MDENVVSWEALRKQTLKPKKPVKPNVTRAQIEWEKEKRRGAQEQREERRAKELEKLEPVAIEVLEEQLAHPDPRIRQAAAKMILEHKWGKPTQKAEVKQEVTKVVYESAAITYEDEEIA